MAIGFTSLQEDLSLVDQACIIIIRWTDFRFLFNPIEFNQIMSENGALHISLVMLFPISESCSGLVNMPILRNQTYHKFHQMQLGSKRS